MCRAVKCIVHTLKAGVQSECSAFLDHFGVRGVSTVAWCIQQGVIDDRWV